MANVTDVIGFIPADSGVILCADCAAGDIASEDDARGSVVFGGSETDAPTHCDECGALIPEALTIDGVAYVANALADYIASVLFVNADGTAKYGGNASTLDAWRDEYSDAIRYGTDRQSRIADAYDAVRERERERIAVVLVTMEGTAREYGDDIYGRVWTESTYEGDNVPEDCCYCGATVWNGWQCLDGGEVCCSSHVISPAGIRAVAARYSQAHGGSVYAASLAKLAAFNVVDGIATDAAESWLSVVTRGRWDGIRGVDDARRERHYLAALVEYCQAMRSRVYADAILAIKDKAYAVDDDGYPLAGHVRLADIQIELEKIWPR